MATDKETFTFTVMVHTCCLVHAEQAMAERLGHDGHHGLTQTGFTYTIDWRERQ